ncbi:trypsin delta-like [Musca vetustissima]|uniref:trypsin delta-like n=1 Tax=Musca vetustissima TaxID=27455 RepID=UPI002AB6DC8F|nr:trypsin delta-like [Musca vetustissima]
MDFHNLLLFTLSVSLLRWCATQPFNSTSADIGYDGRIVGGEVTSILSYPFQVSVQHDSSHICGGSILAVNIILTAAHCIEYPEDVKGYRIRAGSNSHSRGGQLLTVRQIIIHEAYNLNELNCDVALIRLNERLTFSSRIRAIDLPQLGAAVPKNVDLFVSGWGLTSETGLIAPLLQHVAVRLMDQRVCEENYLYIANITPEMFCAGLPEGGKDSCQGDSGGPLLATIRPIQYGIVSFGVGCAQPGYPGVYVNVAALRPWIDRKIKEMTKLS